MHIPNIAWVQPYTPEGAALLALGTAGLGGAIGATAGLLRH